VNELPVRATAFTLILMGVVTACAAEQTTTPETATEPTPRVEERTLSFVAELESLPMPSSDEVMSISIVDLRALSAVNGVDIPDRTDEAAVLEWTRVLAGNGTSPSVASAELPWLIRGDPTAFTSETGLSVTDFATFASLITTPEEFTVVRGDWAGVEPARSLTDVEEGIVSVGTGEDYDAGGGGSRHGADFFGRPVRLARVEDRIALSLSTPMIRRWREVRGPTLADDSSLLAVGQTLDRTEAVSAYLVAASRTDAVGAYGVGWAMDQGAPLIIGVYDAGCAAGAKRLVEPLRRMFERGGRTGAFKDVLTLTSVSAMGRSVLATLTVGDGAGVLTPLEAIEDGTWPQTPDRVTSLC
jgi:hypothetical protein